MNEGGQLLGIMVSADAGPVGLALTFQLADEDFADSTDDVSNVTLAGTFGDGYIIYNLGDDGDANPQYATIGYTQNLSDSTLIYYKYQLVDADTDADSENILRATLKVDI